MLVEDLARRRQRRRLSADEWHVVFADWQASGLSKTGYCKLKNITLSCFARWYQRLCVSKEDLQSGLQSPAQVESLLDSSLGDKGGCVWSSFIPVRVDSVPGTPAPGLKLDIALSNGHRVCVDGVSWHEVMQLLGDRM